MRNNTRNIFIASLKAGLLPALLAPIFWPFIVLIEEGKFPDWSIYPTAIIPIAFFAVLIGTICCLTLGVPTLVIMQNLNINIPIIAAVVGLIYAVILFFIFGPSFEQATISQSWPVYMFLGVLGAVCGFIASYLSRRPNKALQVDA